ncbi:MAG: hypothetical protein U1E67_19055 [Hyphomicrobiales bacterium]
MKRSSGLMVVALAALMLAGESAWIGSTGQTEAAQTTTKKTSTKKPVKKKAPPKKSYCGYPAPPLPVGMSDFCAREYDLFCRRGVGCNQYGR